MSTARNLYSCGSSLVQKPVCNLDNRKCHKLQKRKSQIKIFAVLSNHTFCKVFNLECAGKSEQWRKTGRFLWNQEGVFLSGNKAKARELVLGGIGYPRSPFLGDCNGFSGFQEKPHEGKKRPHSKMGVHEPKATGCWSPTWCSENLVGPFVGIAENWRLCVWKNIFLRSNKCQKIVGRSTLQASWKQWRKILLRKEVSATAVLNHRQSRTAELPLASFKTEEQVGCYTNLWRSAMFEV